MSGQPPRYTARVTIEHRCVSTVRPTPALAPLPPLVHVPA